MKFREVSYPELIEMFSAPRYTVCPRCEGRGHLGSSPAAFATLFFGILVVEICPECEGSGFGLYISKN